MGNFHPTFWAQTKKNELEFTKKLEYVKGDIPKTRYVILFNLYKSNRISFSKSFYDDEKECMLECNELDEMYKNHPLPVKLEKIKNTTNYDYDGKSWWGYIVLDFETKTIIKVGGHGFKTSKSFKISDRKCESGIFKLNKANIPEIRDYFFRDVDIVPDNYDWDGGEYEGWLRYKWGDGKNAIGYVEQKKESKNNKPQVVIYTEDYSEDYLPYTEAEINATEEYVDNGNSLENKNTTSSIIDMLGDDNPLLKLKEQLK